MLDFENNKQELEETIMELIINSGESKSYAMDGLRSAKKGEWENVDKCLELSSQAIKKAHDVQTGLIGLDEGTGKLPVNLIMVHAQDHIMTAMLARDLIFELIEIHKKL